MASTRQVIAGAWSVVGVAAGGKLLSDHRSYMDRLPCVRLALVELEKREDLGSSLSVGLWPRQGHVDWNAGLMRARFEVCGKDGSRTQVLVGAQSEAMNIIDVEDEGWKYYWLRPWELKKALLEKLRSFRREADPDPSKWRVDTLVLCPAGGEPQVLMGNPLALPEYEVLCLRRDGNSKDANSRRRLYIALCISFLGTLVAGGARFLKAQQVMQSHGFIRRAVLANPSIQAVLGPSHIESCTGTFTPTYINAKLKVLGESRVANVTVAGSRQSTQDSWRIVARMNVGGVMCNLDIV